MKITFYYVRHGETFFNRKGRMQGISDSPLSEQGILESRRASMALKDIWFHHAYVSPSERCLDTAAMILEGRGMEAEIERDLHEMTFGRLEGTRFTSHSDEIRHCMDIRDFSSTDGESNRHIIERLTSTIEAIKDNCEDGDNVLLVAHAFVERVLLQDILHINFNAFATECEKVGRKPLPNGGIMVFTYEDGVFSLTSYPCEPEKFKAPKETKNVHFIYVRHGETLFNEWGRMQGWCDSPLTEIGRKQAKDAARLLRKEPIASAFCSTSLRARDTADIILKGRNITLLPLKGLKELGVGDFEGVVAASWMKEINERHQNEEWDDVGGESEHEIHERIEHTLKFILSSARDGDTILIVSHANYYLCLLKALFGIQRNHYMNQRRIEGHRPVPNGGIFRFDYTNGQYKVVSFMQSPEEIEN